jgi:peptidyl-prolyl cis-trans isomerase A (cyclophilin A)
VAGCGAFPAVKPIVLLIALAATLHAELLATFNTSQGNVVVSLRYDVAPQAVANFITLAQGTRTWVDSSTGEIRKEQYYNATTIHRTSNNSSFKIAQGGSQRGDSQDGPGYTFKDEFSPTLLHTPYVLSMANAGPNTNGAQFFFTGNLAQPTFDFSYTIFGQVTDPVSRAVVDAMITAGPNATTINSITLQRTDAAAIAFDEHAQLLPIVFQPGGQLAVTRGVSATWNFQPFVSSGDVLNVFRSQTMAANDWQELASQHTGIGSALLFPVTTSAVLDDASAAKAFYQLSIARHPGSVAPSHLANRTMLLELGDDIFQYQFNNTGSGGLLTIIPATGSSLLFSFTTLEMDSGGHHIIVVLENIGIASQYRYFLVKIGCDSATATQISGRHTIQLNNIFGWYPFSAGQALISR